MARPTERGILMTIFCATLAGVAASLALAQSSPSDLRAQLDANQPTGAVAISSNGKYIWLAAADKGRTVLAVRGRYGDFAPGPLINESIAGKSDPNNGGDIFAIGDDVFVLFPDGELYDYSREDGSPLRNLPDGARPLDIIGELPNVFALVPSAAAAKLERWNPNAPSPAELDANQLAPEPEMFAPGDAPLSLVRFDGRAWRGVAPLPASVQVVRNSPVGPRLVDAGAGRLLLAWAGEADNTLRLAEIDLAKRQFTAPATMNVEDLAGFWLTRVEEVPAIVVAGKARSGAEPSVRLLRRLDLPAKTLADGWVSAPLKLSSLPEGESTKEVLYAFGFNQNIGLFVATKGEKALLVFGRADGPPTIDTVDIVQVITKQTLALRDASPLLLLPMFILLVLFGALFMLRRDSMTNNAIVPYGYAIAFSLQRLGAWIVDFVPFSIAAAYALEIEWWDSLVEVAEWGFSSDGTAPNILVGWWALSCGGYIVYALIMELLTARTVGKVLLGIRVFSETGTRPRPWQVASRNLFRAIELVPQFWVLAFLVLLSRNHQRLGDLFGRTVVLRRLDEETLQREAQLRTGQKRGNGGESSDDDEDAPAGDTRPGDDQNEEHAAASSGSKSGGDGDRDRDNQ